MSDLNAYAIQVEALASRQAARINKLEAENERLRRQVEFVKRENSADTSDDGTGCCMLCFCDHNEKHPHHADCPHNEANRKPE